MIELRRNPDTGDIEKQVVSYEKVELAQLQGEYDNALDAINQADVNIAALQDQLNQAIADKSAKESALSEAKSLVDTHNVLAATSQAANDSGSENSDTAVSADSPATATADVELF